MKYYPETEIVIKSAAVADFSNKIPFYRENKKQGFNLNIELKRNPDI